MIGLGNFLFRYRNALFPFTVLLLLLPGPRLVADPLVAAAIGFAVAALGQFVRAVTIGLEYIVRGGREGKVYAEGLVVAGIYHHTRNPMYVGNILIVIGMALASNSLCTLLLAVPLVVLAYCAIVAAEEHYLFTRFGAAYDAYRRDVPRWLPTLRDLGQTFGHATFHWRRVLVKEYGTPTGWVAVLCAIALRNLWAAGQWDQRRDAAGVLIALAVAVALFWTVARVLKKSHRIEAD